MMKKYLVLSLVAVMSFVSLAPALAHENEGKNKSNGNKVAVEIRKELNKEVKEERKELRKEIKEEKKEVKDEIKELEQALRFAPKALTFVGTLVSVNTTSTSSTEITINVAKVLPNRPKRMSSSTISYPESGKNITFKITGKTLLIKSYGGKMTVSEMSVGDELRIVGKFSKDGSLDVRVIKDNSLHSLRSKKGVVESIGTSTLSFVLKQDNRTLIVKTDATTKFSMRGNTSTSFDSLKVGSKVTVSGFVNTNTKTVIAHSVTINKLMVVPVPAASTSTVSST